MEFPCSRKHIDRFEEDNQGLISINVYKLLNEKTNNNNNIRLETVRRKRRSPGPPPRRAWRESYNSGPEGDFPEVQP